jgi:hypothetical protein
MVRLQGLVTLLAGYAPHSLVGFISHRQRSWDSLFEAFSSREVSKRFRLDEPAYRFSHECYRRRSERAGLAGRGSRALTLTRVPGDRHGFMAPTTGCSLELHPFRVIPREPWRRFRSTSSHVLRPPTEADDPAPRSLDQFPLGPVQLSAASRKRWNRTTLIGSRTCTIPHTRANRHPGYVFTSHGVAHHCRLDPWSLGGASLDRSCRDCLRCQASATLPLVLHA